MTSIANTLRILGHEMRRDLRRMWWVFVIVLPLVGFGLYLAVDHSNANQVREQHRSDARLEQKFRQAIAISDAKHQQALHSQAVLYAYSINKGACVLQSIAEQQIVRLETTKSEGYKAAEAYWRNIRDNQVPIPADLDCSTLPKKPPKVSAAS